MSSWHLTENDVLYESASSYLENLGEKYALFTVEPPWNSLSKTIKNTPEQVFLIHETDKEILDGFVPEVKGIKKIVGIGGGRAIDSAKYVSLKTGGDFISMPSVIGADAYITPVAAIRTDGIVAYLGNKFASEVVIDTNLIRTAPSRLNRAGIGDIYSTRISLMDWKYAREHASAEYDPKIVNDAEKVLSKLHADRLEIFNVTEKGIRSLVSMHVRLNEMQWPFIAKGRTWPQEGIEHVFFYSLEKVTGRTFSHGEVLGTGCIIGAFFHGADVEEIMRDLDSFGVRYRPKDYGISFEEFETAIHHMKSTTVAMGSRYEILDDRELSQHEMKKLWDLLV
ncbi:MAG TPA: iron-containing alcohol dehydrogenase [Nitrososphaerales archaeon]|nr:iron-containing alcohol dehydrogenase [Nitrososphaerales archaeon]